MICGILRSVLIECSRGQIPHGKSSNSRSLTIVGKRDSFTLSPSKIVKFRRSAGQKRLSENTVASDAEISPDIKRRMSDIQHHYIRELIENNHIKVRYTPTRDMLADFLTKGLNRVAHSRCLAGCGFMTSRGSVGIKIS